MYSQTGRITNIVKLVSKNVDVQICPIGEAHTWVSVSGKIWYGWRNSDSDAHTRIGSELSCSQQGNFEELVIKLLLLACRKLNVPPINDGVRVNVGAQILDIICIDEEATLNTLRKQDSR